MAHRKKHKSFLDGLGDLGLATGDKICRYNVRVFGPGRKPVVKPGVTCFTIRARGLERAKKATEGRGASAFITPTDAATRAARKATRAAAKATRAAEKTRAKATKKANRKAASEARVATRRSKSRSTRRAGKARDEYGNVIRRRKK